MATNHTQAATVYQAIYGRRMAWKFKDEPFSKSAIQRMLDAAVWAPNHHMTEPWRFFVLEKDSPVRAEVAELAYQSILERTQDQNIAGRGRDKVLDPPYVIYVYCVPGKNEAMTLENYAAVCCAAQNISLAGAAEGLAVAWETGGATQHPRLNEVVGADDAWSLATMLLIGIPTEWPTSRRTAVSKFVSWFGPGQSA